MVKAALVLLLAASFLQVGASLDAPEGFARWPKGLRRLSSSTPTNPFPVACRTECEGLDDMFDDFVEYSTANHETVLDSEKLEIAMFCTHKDTVQCVVDAVELCNSSQPYDDFVDYSTKLDCICNECPGGKLAWAKYQASQSNGGGADTTTMGDADSAVGTTDDPSAGRRAAEAATNFSSDKDTNCARYELALCIDDYAACSSGFGGSPFSEDDMTELESICTGEHAPGAGDWDLDDDDDDAGDVVSSCGPVGLGWIAASLAPMMAALQFVAA